MRGYVSVVLIILLLASNLAHGELRADARYLAAFTGVATFGGSKAGQSNPIQDSLSVSTTYASTSGNHKHMTAHAQAYIPANQVHRSFTSSTFMDIGTDPYLDLVGIGSFANANVRITFAVHTYGFVALLDPVDGISKQSSATVSMATGDGASFTELDSVTHSAQGAFNEEALFSTTYLLDSGPLYFTYRLETSDVIESLDDSAVGFATHVDATADWDGISIESFDGNTWTKLQQGVDFGQSSPYTPPWAEFTNDGTYSWFSGYQTPEPAAIPLMAIVAIVLRRRRSRSSRG